MTTVTSFGSDIRCLSSGTLSKLLRDNYFKELQRFITSRYQSRRILDVNPLQAADGWIIDRVQFALARFAEVCPDQKWETWRNVWESWLRNVSEVHFKCSYMGGVDWLFKGVRYECKEFVSDYEAEIYNGTREEFERAVVPRLGTIRREHGTGEFPHDELCVLFPFHTPIRFNADRDYELEFHPDYPTPRIGEGVCRDRCNYYRDRKFDAPVELYEAWREIALSC
jgi:hypothetical protein